MLTGRAAAVWLMTGLLVLGGVSVPEENRPEERTVTETAQADVKECREMDTDKEADYETLLLEESACREELAEKEAALKKGEASQQEVMALQERFHQIQIQKLELLE